mmetsp:Transcript_26845/g.48515  ORF Transcript_26845/g.48515 Transcript_26845/m.48515 type:complete len:242 (-) Transcript_26845:220-945(-)
MHRSTASLAHSHQTRHNGGWIVGRRVQHLTPIVGWYATHIVVHGWQNRDWFFVHIHTRKHLRRFGDARQTFRQRFCRQVAEIQVNVIPILTHTTAFADFHGHGAGHVIPRGKVFILRRITLHKALAFGVGQIPAFAACTFRDKTARAVDPSWVKLDKFHVLQWQTRTGYHTAAITGTGVGRSGREIGTAITTGRQHNHLRIEDVHGAVVELPANHTLTLTVLRHDQIKCEILNVELGVVLH